MNVVDATNRTETHEDAEPPSLITIILDTNPHAWALLENSLSLSKLVANLLVFINAHLAINHGNKVAVLASHSERAEWLYPTAVKPKPENSKVNGNANNNEDVVMVDEDENSRSGGPVQPPDDANKYRAFARIEQALTTNINSLLSSTTPSEFTSTPATMIAGALTMALTYISKQTAALPSNSNTATQFNYSDPTSVAGGNDLGGTSNGSPGNLSGLTSRILILSVSGDLATQYIPIMNTIFACQRLSVPIDILKLAGDTVFLQQAADVTSGIYMALDSASARAGLLGILMGAYLPDRTARRHLVTPGERQKGVDFRAACFCHRKVVDVGLFNDVTKMPDIVIMINDKTRFFCHQAILGSQSEVLFDECRGISRSVYPRRVLLYDDNEKAVETVLRFCYSCSYGKNFEKGGKFHLDVFRLAKTFKIPDLQNLARAAFCEALKTTSPYGISTMAAVVYSHPAYADDEAKEMLANAVAIRFDELFVQDISVRCNVLDTVNGFAADVAKQMSKMLTSKASSEATKGELEDYKTPSTETYEWAEEGTLQRW